MKQNVALTTALAPVSVVMVSCGDMENSDIVTIAWAGTVNSDPPMLSVSVRRSRYSYELIKKTGEFVVNLIDASLVGVCDGCGVVSGRNVDKFKKFSLTKQASEKIGAPAVAECPLSMECVVRETVELPTHVMFVAEIVNVRASEKWLSDGKLAIPEGEPVAYVQNRYVATGKTLGNYRAEASAPFSAGLQENLSKTCREGGYGQIVLASDASDETVAKAVSLQRAALKEEYERNRKVIEGFQGIQRAEGGSSAGSGVEQYIVRNGVISSQIGNFTASGEDDGSGTLTAGSVKAFSDTLDAQYRALASAAETLKQVTAVIYAENTWASYPARSIVSEGGINPVLAGAAAFVLSFVVAAIVVCTVDYPAHRAKKEQPAQPPALPQTDGAGGEE